MVDVQITGNIIEDNLKSKSFDVIDEYDLIEPEITGFNHVFSLRQVVMVQIKTGGGM